MPQQDWLSIYGHFSAADREEIDRYVARHGKETVEGWLRAWGRECVDLALMAQGMTGFDAGPMAYIRDEVTKIEGISYAKGTT